MTTPISLTADEIDDILYFTRVNEAEDLQQTIAESSRKHRCQAKEVLESAVDPESGNTALHFCAANGHADLLSALLEQIQDAGVPSKQTVNSQNTEGNTPLHWAAYNGHLPTVKVLIAAGADMWVKNKAGHLAMFEAERAEKSDVVQYLLEAGGKAVEQGGTEGRPSDEEVADVQAAEASSDAREAADADVDMEAGAGND